MEEHLEATEDFSLKGSDSKETNESNPPYEDVPRMSLIDPLHIRESIRMFAAAHDNFHNSNSPSPSSTPATVEDEDHEYEHDHDHHHHSHSHDHGHHHHDHDHDHQLSTPASAPLSRTTSGPHLHPHPSSLPSAEGSVRPSTSTGTTPTHSRSHSHHITITEDSDHPDNNNEHDPESKGGATQHRANRISRKFHFPPSAKRPKSTGIPTTITFSAAHLASRALSRKIHDQLEHDELLDEDSKHTVPASSSPIHVTHPKPTFIQPPASILDDDESYSSGFPGEGEGEEDHIPTMDDFGYEKVKEVYHKIQEVITKMEHEGVLLDPIREEFSSLWEGIESSHDNENRLIQIDRELSSNLSATMAKTRFLIKLAEDDPELAQKLGQQLEKSWNVVDVGEESEKTNQAKIDQLKQDIFDLNRNINQASRVEGRDQLKELTKVKNELERDRDSANTETNKFRSRLNIIFAKRQELFDRRTSLEEKSKLLDQEFLAQNEAIVRETARKERLGHEMEEAKKKIRTKVKEMEELDMSLQQAASKLVETEKAVREQRIVNESAVRDAEFAGNRIDKLRSDLENQQRLVERMTMDAYRRTQEFRVKEEDVHNLKLELHRATRQRALNTRKVVLLQQSLVMLEIDRESLKTKIAILEKDLETAQKKLEDNKKKVEELDKERSFVNRNLRRASAVTSEHANQAKTHEVAVRNLEQAVRNYGEEISEQRHQIFRLEKERDFYSHEATKLAQQVAFQLNDIKKLDMAIFQFRKKLGILETQLKKTQQIYDVAVYDKGVFERTLRDTLTEILENTQKIHLLNNQVRSLKYQVNEKDEIIHREALRYDRILKETDFFTAESRRIQRMAEDVQRQVDALEVERSTLGCSMAEIEAELSKENYFANAAYSRGQVFHRKLMASEVKVREVWEKWRSLHSTIRIGAYHYRNIMREIRETRYGVLMCRKLQASKIKTVTNFSRLRHEVSILENCIAKEKCMMNALKDQMDHPINVHRWRVLEATDTTAYEMVQKINLLTRRLVKRNSELREQTKQLDQKQAMYVEIRDCLQRSPGFETPEEVAYVKHLLVAKKQQFRSLVKELKASEAQTTFYREQVIGLQDRMMSLKQKYFQKLRSGGRKPRSNNCNNNNNNSNHNRNVNNPCYNYDDPICHQFSLQPSVSAMDSAKKYHLVPTQAVGE